MKEVAITSEYKIFESPTGDIVVASRIFESTAVRVTNDHTEDAVIISSEDTGPIKIKGVTLSLE